MAKRGNPNIRNLIGKRFKPGESGNPNGQPPKPISKLLRELGEKSSIECEITFVDSNGEKVTQKIDTRVKGVSVNNAIASMMLDKALSGDVAFVREVISRQEGQQDDKNGKEKDTEKYDLSQFSFEQLRELAGCD
jgi:hypothetical protein